MPRKTVKHKTTRKYAKRVKRKTVPFREGKRTPTKGPKMTTNTTGYQVKTGVPLPWGRIKRNEIEYPLEFMDIGASFQLMQDGKGASKVYSACVAYCKMEENFHKKFVVRKIKEEVIKGKEIFTYGCWRVSDLTPEEIKEKKEQIGIQYG